MEEDITIDDFKFELFSPTIRLANAAKLPTNHSLVRWISGTSRKKSELLEQLTDLIISPDICGLVAKHFTPILCELVGRATRKISLCYDDSTNHDHDLISLLKATNSLSILLLTYPYLVDICSGFILKYKNILSGDFKCEAAMIQMATFHNLSQFDLDMFFDVINWPSVVNAACNASYESTRYDAMCCLLHAAGISDASTAIPEQLFQQLKQRINATQTPTDGEMDIASLDGKEVLFTSADIQCNLKAISNMMIQTNNHIPSHLSPSNGFVLTRSSLTALQGVIFSLTTGTPVLLEGELGTGKTVLLEYLAQMVGRASAPDILKLQLGDQTDSKSIIGMHVCTEQPGEFKWQPGTLTQAVENGSWLILEDIDSAPLDVVSVLIPLMESKSLVISGISKIINAAPGFQLFLTRRVQKGHNHQNAPSAAIEHLCSTICLEPMTKEELEYIACKKYPHLETIIPKLIDVYAMISSDLNLRSTQDTLLSNLPSDKRLCSSRDFFKWCQRIAERTANSSLTRINWDLLEESFSCFCIPVAGFENRKLISHAIGAKLGIPKDKVYFYLSRYKACVQQTRSTFSVGRNSLPRIQQFDFKMMNISGTSSFAFTRHALNLLEQIAVCVIHNEPVLLVGETGCGKTATIQYLARQCGHKFSAINMSQQSDVTDLLGGFKPVDAKQIFLPIREKFESLFNKTFSEKQNIKFLGHIQQCWAQKKWEILFKLMMHCKKAAIQRKGVKKDFKDMPRIMELWKQFGTELKKVQNQLKNENALAFKFIEGGLIKAIRDGEWILLDEINLATAETLECLSGLLESKSGSIVLVERGDAEPIRRHENFRLFACMNPATDVGKKDLPFGIRNRFSEIYVDELNDVADLKVLVAHYLQDSDITSPLVDGIVKFYQRVQLAAKDKLRDGTGHRPHYSLRTLCRALEYAASNSKMMLPRAICEGFCLSFLTQLDRSSHPFVESLIRTHIFGHVPNFTSILSKPMPAPGKSAMFCNVEGYWVAKGDQPLELQQEYVLTSSVKENLNDLARVVSGRKYPVLLQGETSVGKTSLINYLAKKTGNQCLRINNHEHTDIQEYIGCYSTDVTGKLVFKDGLLVDAMRKGYWIILDELNLAPTDVLEALNRLLDDNRELFIAETQETIKAHEKFILFATQNPPGQYGGRKILSRAFRNRFVELHFDEIPSKELEIILHKRCELPKSYCKKFVNVMHDLQTRRKLSGIFAGKHGFITLRDLFRWAERYRMTPESTTISTFYDWDQHIAEDGYMLLAGRCRKAEEADLIKETIEKIMKRQINLSELYGTGSITTRALIQELDSVKADEFKHLVWTSNLRRMAVLVGRAMQFNEPILLVGDTGCGKTTICQLFSHLRKSKLHTINCHMHTESSDFIGGLRPVRQRDDKNEMKLFEWCDGPLVDAMKDGSSVLIDEISLADDSVLERLNSVLETEKLLVLAEKGGSSDDDDIEIIIAHDRFRLLATMNPGGDFGKKELSPALRNRFSEIWCPQSENPDDFISIVNHNIRIESGDNFGMMMIEFIEWFKNTEAGQRATISIRDLLCWVDFINTVCDRNKGRKEEPNSNNNNNLHPKLGFIHGAFLVIIDSLGTGNSWYGPSFSLEQARDACLSFLKLHTGWSNDFPRCGIIRNDAGYFGMSPFFIQRGNLSSTSAGAYSLDARTTSENALRLLRALQLSRPILLEGSPGVGKTSLVTAVAKISGNEIVRINLSEQTDVTDLFGADLPVEGGKGGEFEWRDGPFLKALKAGNWVVLDELNLASQSVLEGLNACFDHRAEVFVPELGMSFQVAHEKTKIFACQNPFNQGGGRKGLPKSFLNRFTKVYIDSLKEDDLGLIITAIYPEFDQSILIKMIQFNTELKQRIMVAGEWGMRGSPWEFNVRDILRWCELIMKYQNVNSEKCDPSEFLNLVYEDRMRTIDDKKKIVELYAKIFNDSQVQMKTMTRRTKFDIGDDRIQIGHSVLPRTSKKPDNLNTARNELQLLRRQIPCIESVMKCIEMNWMAILVGGKACGKTSIVESIAYLSGNTLNKLTMNSNMDTTELLGGFEQVNLSRHFVKVVKRAENHVDGLLRSCIKSAEDICNETEQLNTLLHIKTKLRSLQKCVHDGAEKDSLQASSMFEEFENLLQTFESLKKAPENFEELKETFAALKNRFIEEQRSLHAKGQFEWVDGVLVESLKEGNWLLIENVNLCSPSVLDRLNGLLEPNGVLSIDERGVLNGEIPTVKPHPNFRLFLSMDPKYGEISRAMRNRGIEIFITGEEEDMTYNDADKMQLLASVGLGELEYIREPLVNIYDELRKADLKVIITDLILAARMVSELLNRGFESAKALEKACILSFVKNGFDEECKQKIEDIVHASIESNVNPIGQEALDFNEQRPNKEIGPCRVSPSIRQYSEQSLFSRIERDGILLNRSILKTSDIELFLLAVKCFVERSTSQDFKYRLQLIANLQYGLKDDRDKEIINRICSKMDGLCGCNGFMNISMDLVLVRLFELTKQDVCFEENERKGRKNLLSISKKCNTGAVSQSLLPNPVIQLFHPFLSILDSVIKLILAGINTDFNEIEATKLLFALKWRDRFWTLCSSLVTDSLMKTNFQTSLYCLHWKWLTDLLMPVIYNHSSEVNTKELEKVTKAISSNLNDRFKSIWHHYEYRLHDQPAMFRCRELYEVWVALMRVQDSINPTKHLQRQSMEDGFDLSSFQALPEKSLKLVHCFEKIHELSLQDNANIEEISDLKAKSDDILKEYPERKANDIEMQKDGEHEKDFSMELLPLFGSFELLSWLATLECIEEMNRKSLDARKSVINKVLSSFETLSEFPTMKYYGDFWFMTTMKCAIKDLINATADKIPGHIVAWLRSHCYEASRLKLHQTLYQMSLESSKPSSEYSSSKPEERGRVQMFNVFSSCISRLMNDILSKRISMSTMNNSLGFPDFIQWKISVKRTDETVDLLDSLIKYYWKHGGLIQQIPQNVCSNLLRDCTRFLIDVICMVSHDASANLPGQSYDTDGDMLKSLLLRIDALASSITEIPIEMASILHNVGTFIRNWSKIDNGISKDQTESFMEKVKLTGMMSVSAGLVGFILHLPTSPFDLVEEAQIKAKYFEAELEEIDRELKLRYDFVYHLTGFPRIVFQSNNDVTIQHYTSNPDKVRILLQRRDFLLTEISKLQKQIALRPDTSKYDDLLNDLQHYQSNIGNPGLITKILTDLNGIAGGKPVLKTFEQKIEAFMTSTEHFIENLDQNYSLYQDVYASIKYSLRQIIGGFGLILSYLDWFKKQAHFNNSVKNFLKQDSWQFPSPSVIVSELSSFPNATHEKLLSPRDMSCSLLSQNFNAGIRAIINYDPKLTSGLRPRLLHLALMFLVDEKCLSKGNDCVEFGNCDTGIMDKKSIEDTRIVRGNQYDHLEILRNYDSRDEAFVMEKDRGRRSTYFDLEAFAREILNEFCKIWMQFSRQRQVKEAEEDSMYRFKSKLHCMETDDADINEQQYKEYFPSFNAEFDDLIPKDSLEDYNNLSPPIDDAELSSDVTEEGLQSSEMEYVNTCAIYDAFDDFYNAATKELSDERIAQCFMACQREAVQLSSLDVILSDPFLDSNMASSSLFMTFLLKKRLSECSVFESTTSSQQRFDIYHDSNIFEVRKLIALLGKFLLRLDELLAEFAEHPVLLQTKKIIERILSFPINQPLMKFLTGLEILLKQTQEWEAYASSRVSLSTHVVALTQQIIEWRKLELRCWPYLLQVVENKFTKQAKEWFLKVYSACTDLLHTQEDEISRCKELAKLVQQFLETSPLGEFLARLNLVFILYKLMEHEFPDSSIVLWNIYHYYKQFTGNIIENIRKLKTPIEKELKDFVKIARWKDINYYAIKEATEKSHRSLHKFIRKYQEALSSTVSDQLKLIHTSVTETKLDKKSLNDTSRFRASIDVLTLLAGVTSQDEWLNNSATLSAKMIKKCVKFMRQAKHNAMIEALDELSGDIIENIKDLQSVEVLSLPEEKRSQARKHLHARKRKGLATLFKTLSTIGLSYRKGLAVMQQDEEELSVTSPIIELKGSRSELMLLMNDCHGYYFKCLARSSALHNAMRNPSRELTPQDVARCKGLSQHLMHVIQGQRKHMSSFIESYQSISGMVKELKTVVNCKEAVKNKASLLPIQSVTVSRMRKLKKHLDLTIYVVMQFRQLMNSCPASHARATESPLSADSFPLINSCCSEDELVKRTLENIETILGKTKEAKGKIDAIVHCFSSPSFATWEHVDTISSTLVLLERNCELLQDIEDNFTCSNVQPIYSTARSIEMLKTQTRTLIFDFLKTDSFYAKSNESTSTTNLSHVVNAAKRLFKSVLVSIQELNKLETERSDTIAEIVKEANDDEDKDEEEFDLADGHLIPRLDKDFYKEIALLYHSSVSQKLHALFEETRKLFDAVINESNELFFVYAGLVQYVEFMEYFMEKILHLHRTSCKLLYVITGVFTELAAQGFCLPPEEVEASGEGATEFEDIEGGGIGEGEGMKDVSNQIENEDQLQEAKQEGQEEKDEPKGEDKIEEEEDGIEMTDDFDGQMHDVDQNEDGNQSDEDNKENEEDVEDQMGKFEENEEEKLDEKFWGDSDDEENDDNQADEDEKGPGAEAKVKSELVAKDENEGEQEGKAKENKDGDVEEDDQDEVNELSDNELNDNDKGEDENEGGEKNQEENTNKADDNDGAVDEFPSDLELDDEDDDENGNDNGIEKEEKAMNEDMNDEDEAIENEEEDGGKSENVEEEEKEAENEDDAEAKNDEQEGIKDPDKQGEEPQMEEQEDVHKPDQEQKDSKDDTSQPSDTQAFSSSLQSVAENNSFSDAQSTAEEMQQQQQQQQNTGSSQQQGTDGHDGISSVVKQDNDAGSQQKNRRKEYNKSRQDRSLANDLERKLKRTKTTEADDSFKDEKENEVSADIYQHVRDNDSYDAHALDAATAEQALQQPDTKPRIEDSDTEMQSDEDEMPEEQTNDDSKATSAPKDSRLRDNKLVVDEIETNTETEMNVEEPLVDDYESNKAAIQSAFFTSKDALIKMRDPVKLERENEKIRRELEQRLASWAVTRAHGAQDESEAIETWRKYENLTATFSQQLCEQLRLVLEPTLASKLRGDYRSGKRLNMRKVIPYIASQFRKDKIWLRRTKKSRRQYQIMLAVDDSSSMGDNHSQQLAFESLAVISNALTWLEAGELAVCSFGETTKLLHSFREAFNERAGSHVLNNFTFGQKKTNVALMLDTCSAFMTKEQNVFEKSRIDTSQLLLIVSDGRGIFLEGKEVVERSVRNAREAGLFIVFIIIDNPSNRDSILDIKVPIFKPGGLPEIKSYMDEFPFPFYLILRDINSLPVVLSDALRQWFELVTSM